MAYKQLKLWFEEELAEMLADKILPFEPTFNKASFIKSISLHITPLELKDRIEVFADELGRHLGKGYETNIKLLIQILGPENEKEVDMFKRFYWIMPIAKYVEKYGLDHFEISMEAISEITRRNTGEYCIRPFLKKYPSRTLAVMEKWAEEKNFHLRRLASEGGRPKLPWASKLQQFIDDPAPLFPILDKLKDDPKKYVQKSVANCLNDILKDNYGLGKAFISRWMPVESKERKWIIKHALRNLKKSKDPWAMEVLAELKA
ncbi:MAG: DNA alkylation repair protein [Bacteroidota bacterium]